MSPASFTASAAWLGTMPAIPDILGAQCRVVGHASRYWERAITGATP
jgi:hypothetical protein